MQLQITLSASWQAGGAGRVPQARQINRSNLSGETGFLVDSVEACASRVQQLLEQADLRTKSGSAGREHVRSHYLTPHHLRDYLQLFQAIHSA
jgi:glycosyltransferase involved in cell wall biosynthesis